MPIHVLFVEDEEDLRAVVADALSAQGFDVTIASTGIEAIAYLRGEGKFTIVVTDYSMPGSATGLDVAVEAALSQPLAKVVISSGLQRSQLPVLPENVRFLPKPYRFRQLTTAIHEQVDCRRGT
ncbi:response regulator [Stenotrophomonas sp. GD03958]|uniref:response regulator n=1 Tax=Stenotrophomonas sp. GD03958 TaxID=2975411 RepID=UPI00073952F5|nr:response regulator [Stenotrophomonas sp. GD03958]MCM2523194.1 response regulator [Stenotrophomonas maltophilia]MCU1088397.1 response regulator [Stenotrophomonas maltophilia]MDH1193092.1 response regulator [Stenotrophomonas sp. GD03958]CRD65232.1 Two-component system regulatory protein [Stenotrophomonas maltophilia]